MSRPEITPEDFFADRELNALHPGVYETADQIWTTIKAEQDRLDNLPKGGELRSLIRSHTTGGPLFFRGQSDHRHGLSTSLHRFMRRETSEEITERGISELEAAIIDEMRGRGLGRGMTDGELLMVLQHHGGPTRLMDVSDRPLEALFFAVEGADATDGRLFIIHLNPDVVTQKQMELSARQALPWSRYARGRTRAVGEWTQTVSLINERPLDPRMAAQRGRFLVGGLQRAYAGLTSTYKTHPLNAFELQQISMLTIGFRKQARSDSSWPALGWTIRIPAATKARLRELLTSEGIEHSTMYPDYSAAAWQSSEAARTETHTRFWRSRLQAD